jgi:hypothetical protein
VRSFSLEDGPKIVQRRAKIQEGVVTEPSRTFTEESRELILDLARRFADEQIRAREHWDAAGAGEFCDTITSTFMACLQQTHLSRAAEPFCRDILHEFRLRCDQEQTIRIEGVVAQRALGRQSPAQKESAPCDALQWLNRLFRSMLAIDRRAFYLLSEREIEIELDVLKRTLRELAKSAGYDSPRVHDELEEIVESAQKSKMGLKRVSLSWDGNVDPENTFLYFSEENARLIHHFFDLVASEKEEFPKTVLQEFVITIDRCFESVADLGARFAQFKETVKFLQSHSDVVLGDSNKATLYILVIEGETAVWRGVRLSRMTKEFLGQSKECVIKELDRLRQEFISNLPDLFRSQESLLTKLYDRWLIHVGEAFDRAYELCAQLQTFPALSKHLAQHSEFLARQLSPLLATHGQTIEEMVQKLDTYPNIVLLLLQLVVDEEIPLENRLHLFMKRVEFLYTLTQSGEQYTEADLEYLFVLLSSAEIVCVDAYSEAARLPKEVIRQIVATRLPVLEKRELLDESQKRLSDPCAWKFFLYLRHTGKAPSSEELSKLHAIPLVLWTQKGMDLLERIGIDRMAKISRWVARAICLSDELWCEIHAVIVAHPIVLDIVERYIRLNDGERFVLDHMDRFFPRIRRLVEWIDSADSTVTYVPDEVKTLDIYLIPEIAYDLAHRLPAKFWTVRMWYMVESACLDDMWDAFERLISQTELSYVPVEILLRFLAERPTAEAIRWLEEGISIDGVAQKRIQTLSTHQTTAILDRFRTFEGDVSLTQWVQALGVDARRVQEICAFHESEVDASARRLHDRADYQAHMNDPLSLFKVYGLGETSIGGIILDLLVNAKETSLCGGRRRLIWGSSVRSSSICIAEDGTPLRIRDATGRLRTYYQIGMFNPPTHSVPAFALHRQLVRLKREEENDYDCLSYMLDGGFLEGASSHVVELYCEISRIKKHLLATYPRLIDDSCDEESTISDDVEEEVVSPPSSPQTSGGEGSRSSPPDESSDGGSPSSLFDERGDVEDPAPAADDHAALEKGATPLVDLVQAMPEIPLNIRLSQMRDYVCAQSLFALLKVAYRALSQKNAWFNKEQTSHRHAIFLRSILCIVRSAHVTELSSNKIQITLNRYVSFCLEALSPDRWTQPVREDQQEMEGGQFREYVHGFLPYPETPLTSSALSVDAVKEVFLSIQAMPEAAFAEVLQACERITKGPHEEFVGYEYYPTLLAQLCPGVISDSIISFCTQMVGRFGDLMASGIRAELKPNSTYRVNAAVGAFGAEDAVPSWLRSQGNFASAICTTFTPVKPQDHFGNCGVNAFLLGLKGVDTYGAVKGQLKQDIQVFRNEIQRFAKTHRDELLQTSCSKKELDEIIANVTREVDWYGSPMIWANSAIWACAARCYGRVINVYTAYGTDEFRTDAQGAVVPYQPFQPYGEPTGEPIHLLFWDGAHYCWLRPGSS